MVQTAAMHWSNKRLKIEVDNSHTSVETTKEKRVFKAAVYPGLLQTHYNIAHGV